jgi:predicted DNA-binding protein
MITLPEHLEKQLIVLAHRQNATTDTILEWALKSLELDLDDVDHAEQVLADIESGKDTALSLAQLNEALTDDLDS